MYLAFDQGIRPAISKAINDDGDGDGMHLVKAAAIVRPHMLNMANKFKGTFDEGCQESAVPGSLVALVSMDRTDIRGDPELTTTQFLMKLQKTNKIF